MLIAAIRHHRLVCQQAAILWKYRHYKVIYPPPSLGDILFYACMLPKYRQLHPKQKIAVLFSDKNRVGRELFQMFGDVADAIDILPTMRLRCILPSVDKYRQISMHFKNLLNPEDNYAKLLDNRLEYIPGTADVKLRIGEEVLNLFKGHFKQGRTVLICPGATTCCADTMHGFWLMLAEKLREKGFEPVFNESDKSKFAGFRTSFLSITETAQFCEMGGSCIAVRSGIVDVLAYFTSSKLVVLYPEDWNVWRDFLRSQWANRTVADPFGEFMSAWSVRRIYRQKGVAELRWNDSFAAEQVVDSLQELFEDRHTCNDGGASPLQ